ncbi:MAG: HupE/UreJ family protein [Thermodesulfobacteriota bacterium]
MSGVRRRDTMRAPRRAATLALRGALLGIAALAAVDAAAHPLAPSLLELRETAPGTFAVRWKTSALRPTGSRIEPRLPGWCRRTGEERVHDGPTHRERRFLVDCGARGLVGGAIAVSDLAASRTVVVVRLALADGRVVRALLDGARPSLVVPERESRLEVARAYLVLGVEHLLTGLDHLLFVLCLCLLVRGRALLWTITAFTVGHSVTLTLATLGWVSFPQPAAETAIALSIVLLAAEILRDDAPLPSERDASWIRRRPWSMALAFGLLHGLGFAGALSEVGLPQPDIPIALLAFNAGIELGQLAFVGALLALAALLRPLLVGVPARAMRVPAYAIGSLAAYWFFERSGTVLETLLPM